MRPTPSRTASYDVAIVGGRAAGAATALRLARHGLRAVVLERGTPGSDALSTHALMRGGVMQLHRWELLDTIVAAGTPAVRRTTFTYGDDRIEVSIKPSHGVDALYAPRRTLLDPTLSCAASEAGADIRYGTTVTNLIWRRGHVVGVGVRNADGRLEQIGTELVVGADGIHSSVAKLVGARLRRRGTHATAVTYGYWSDLDTTGYEWVFRPDACSGVIPTNGGQACVFASARPARIGRGGIDVIRQIVTEGDPELADRLGRARPPLGTRTWGGHPGYIRQSYGPGWALVGDAGYFKDPISAHGLTDALRDADLLARAVIAGRGQDALTTLALADYQHTRDRLSIALFDTVDRIASNDWDDSEISDLLRQLSSSMADEVETLAALDLEQAS